MSAPPLCRRRVVSSTQLCGYKSGKCPHPRAIKLNGGLHSLCAFHRDKQNAHQRKSDRKMRCEKKICDSQLVDHAKDSDFWNCVDGPPDSLLFQTDAMPVPRTMSAALDPHRHHSFQLTRKPTRLPSIRSLFQAQRLRVPRLLVETMDNPDDVIPTRFYS
ncbi:hypothetical protein H257_08380 [Aphanomyces astaci]|uniref:Uncharacterized protein n=1 Tax=Aphanomyces astaci TaxID=112090 RepID=W4GEV1_APHAT|nr:hypothetical protein H257_08380 [Aphanomyces astaci]ETV78195.1 hypothetical protein H257_08380 [Aphanomyces astaci]|eukprot:XP_009832532.1 hypothetical protein H257_08380 [Aphanomyces astaci]